MERKQSSGFCRIFTVAFDRLFQVNVNDYPPQVKEIRPAGLKLHTGARNRRKTTMKKTTKPTISFSFHDPKMVKPTFSPLSEGRQNVSTVRKEIPMQGIIRFTVQNRVFLKYKQIIKQNYRFYSSGHIQFRFLTSFC